MGLRWVVFVVLVFWCIIWEVFERCDCFVDEVFFFFDVEVMVVNLLICIIKVVLLVRLGYGDWVLLKIGKFIGMLYCGFF